MCARAQCVCLVFLCVLLSIMLKCSSQRVSLRVVCICVHVSQVKSICMPGLLCFVLVNVYASVYYSVHLYRYVHVCLYVNYESAVLLAYSVRVVDVYVCCLPVGASCNFLQGFRKSTNGRNVPL